MNIKPTKALTDEEICDELNRDHKTGQIFFIPNRLRTHLPYCNEIMRLLQAQRDDTFRNTVKQIVKCLDWKHGKDFVTLTELMNLIAKFRQELKNLAKGK